MAVCASCGAENREGARFCDHCGAALVAEPPREARKTVTVLFCDVSGSTALGEQIDPESLRNVMARYFDTAKAAIERHGGTVEKFIGDAVMAVFGVPVVHEDDALRAVRAADELRRALETLNEELAERFGTRVQVRIGVNTGEVVTGTEERLATGDAVNVAARLEQAAQPGEILLGEETERLIRGRSAVEASRPVAAKGKSEPVAAFRLLTVDEAHVPVRPHTARMVGRERQRHLLEEALANVAADRTCQLFTVLGTAGVGKSRLVAEFLAGLEDVTVVSGRCLSYGDGITYFPVTEVAMQLAADAAEHSGLAPILDETAAASSPDEIAAAFRKLLESRAAEKPLVVVFDDIQWGEPTFLDLVEHVADFSRDAPILLLCMARPDLLDRRESWGGGKLNATNVLLEPLPADQAEELLVDLMPAGVEAALKARILEAADGNPLFVEEMVAMVAELRGGNGDIAEISVPPTIHALLAARLDQLDAHERLVLERGSVEGQTFHRGVVEALAPEEREVPRRLMSLVRKELVRPDRAVLAGDDAFRFRHLLIRDAAYDALPKATRADLHERFATWLEQHGQDLVELDEIVGYHLEQAYLYRVQLGLAAEQGRELASRAAAYLAESGRRAFVRGDMPAAARLLERTAALLPEDDPQRLQLLPSLGRALTESNEWERARAVLSDAVASANAAGERGAAADAAVALTFVELHTNPNTSHAKVRPDVEAAIRVFEELDDKAGLARALSMAGMLRFWRGDMGGAIGELERAAGYARDAGDRPQELASLSSIITGVLYGPTPAPAALAKVDEIARRAEGARRLEVAILKARANLEAMQGRFDEARELITHARLIAEELGLEMTLAAGVLRSAGEIELLAGDLAAAENAFRTGSEMLERRGDWGHFASVAPRFAEVLLLQGRVLEAEPVLEVASRWTLADDADAQIAILRVGAKLAASRGALDEADALARQAVARSAETDDLGAHGDALVGFADVLELRGGHDDAVGALEQALELYERKGNVVMAERLRRRLDESPKAAG